MATITGKNGSVTYDVLSQDPELERLLQQVLSVHVNALLNHDKARLQSILSSKSKPKAEDSVSQSPRERYATENLEKPQLIPLGGKWAYSVALIDQNGQREVRIAKGQIRGNFYRDKRTNQMVLMPDDPLKPISQINHINIKRLKEWDELQGPVVSRLSALEESK